MNAAINIVLSFGAVFFLLYLLVYATYLFASVVAGAWQLYNTNRMRAIKNELKHDSYFPVSILVPAHNEELTIVDCVESLLALKYQLFEVIVVDDGSTDSTSQALIDHFHMQRTEEPIRLQLPSKQVSAVYEAPGTRVSVRLIVKANGGKSDALNMGINAARFPYFVCMDADSFLQDDSLERIIQPALEDDNIVAVGGLVRVAQGMSVDPDKGDGVRHYHLPWNLLVGMQVMEYDRSFLASRILLDCFNGNLIISGAFGLFKKDIVVAVGGYATNTVGEDMELIVKLHAFCRSNLMSYSIRYEPNAVCWSQAPFTLPDLARQRKRWHRGLYESLRRYSFMPFKSEYGLVGTVSYLYYFLYELYSPIIELFGLAIIVLAFGVGQLSTAFMVRFYLLFALYGTILTLTAFFQRIYTQNLTISWRDVLRAIVMCFFENVFFRFVLDAVRLAAMIGYKKGKGSWGSLNRMRHKT